MVISLFLRHFKAYQGINYIPVSNGDKFTAFIGENGIGKSSILEALDVFFNSNTHDWNINKYTKEIGGIGGENAPFIMPFFLIEKSEIKEAFKKNAESISTYFWEFSRTTSESSETQKFINQVKDLKEKYDFEQYYLIPIGKKYGEKDKIYFSSFHRKKELRKAVIEDYDTKYSTEVTRNLTEEQKDRLKLEEEKVFQDALKGFSEYIQSLYAYVYIPAETDIQSYTKIETINMQKLMGKDIYNEIKSIITDQSIYDINKKLDKFIEGVMNELPNYDYKNPTRYAKSKLTVQDVINKIIEEYFMVRVLSKKIGTSYIPVENMSSGEKKKALIDVAYAFLKNNVARDKKIIFAIDEPEASLHIYACYNQFENLKTISDLGHQLVITTHWYGFLPVLSKGLCHLTYSKESETETPAQIEFKTYDLYNYRASVKQNSEPGKNLLTYDVNLKSTYDLVQSITASLRNDVKYNWIICEGISEKIYFDSYFKTEIAEKNLRVLPVGGAKEVIRIYKHLTLPIEEKTGIAGKVFCLIDTDNTLPPSLDDISNKKHLMIRRLMNNSEKDTQLVKLNDPTIDSATEIEDCLNPQVYLETMRTFENYPLIVRFFNEEENLKKEAIHSRDILIDPRKSQLQNIKDFFDDNEGGNKVLFARQYSIIKDYTYPEEIQDPNWIKEIKDFFNN